MSQINPNRTYRSPKLLVEEGQGEVPVTVTRRQAGYEEFTEIENNKELADIQATNILNQGLPTHVFNILNQTRTGKEIWDNVELLMKGLGKSLQQNKEELFDEYERFHAIGNESIHDYFINTKFVNNLPPYWAKYVTNVKNNKDISATTYVELYTYLKSYEPHAMKTLKKQEQSTSIVDPLAYLAQTTHYHAPTQTTTPPPPQYGPLTSSTPQQVPQSSNDAMLATMNQIVNLLSGFQKQFPPTNNQLRTSSNSRSHATVHDGQIITETVQRRAPGNVGNTGNRGTQNYGQMTDNVGKKVICYNCRGEGHVSRQCKEKKRVKDSQYFKDKMLLMEAKEKGTVLDAEAEAFLADVECTAPYDQPLAITTTNMFEVSHEDAYDSDVDEGPHAAAAFMANLSSTSGTNGATTSQVNEVHTDANQIFDNVNHLLTHEMHQEEHLDSDVESDIDDNTIPYHQYQLDSEVQDVPTEVSSAPPGEISMITILDDLRTQLDGHLKVNQEQSLVNDSLRAELARCKQEMVSLERNKVKHDLDQTIIQRNKRNAELEEENVLLKSKLSQNVESINSLKNESKKVVSEKKVLEDKYLEEIVCLKSANKVATEILQRFQQPTQTIPMLTKRPNLATHDLHKTALGSSNPWNLKQAKLSRPTLYDGHALLNTTHSPVRVNDSEDALVQAEVSRAKMSERPGTIKPINYAELNALYSHFVPQKELSREQVYWLPAEEIASQNSNPPKPVTPFVHTRPAPSKVRAQLLKLKECFPAFETIIKRRTTPTFHEQGEWRFVHTKKAFTEQVIPFYEHVKELVQSLDENLVKEVTEFMRIFDELDTEYEQCVLEKKNLQIKKKNLLIQNECLITDSIAKDICSIVLVIAVLRVKPATGASKPMSKKSELRTQSTFADYKDVQTTYEQVIRIAELINYVDKFISTVRFGNDQFAAIIGYGDYKLGNTIISRVYYLKGLSHNLFSVGQFCDGGLEVAFRQHTCHIRNKHMVDLLQGSRSTNLYSISLNEMLAASPVCLLTKASSTKSWLWHRRLNHLDFGTLNKLAQNNLVRGLPMLKYDKDHLCPSCQLGKSKKSSHPLKTVNTNTEILNTLHMDLCRPIRVESINKKKYILVIVDDYTRFGWVRFLRTNDETPEVLKKFIVTTQRALNATVRYVRTDNGTEFVNKTLTEFFESVGITHNTSVPRFLWAEAVAIACYTLNRSLIHTLHGKTYYEVLKGKKPELQNFRVFGSLYYPTNDYDDLGKLKAKTDIVRVNAALAPEMATGSPSITINTEDAPAAITSSSESQTPPPDTGVTGIETPLPTNDSDLFEPYIAPETASAASSSGTVIVDVTLNSPITHVQKWTKDHPLENVIGDLHRPVSTRQQLETDAMWCFFNEFLTHVEPKNYKQALEHSCWIEAMQEELLHELETS
ncbi:retrovirus-related pol polyprotein from transposon TNT 1-94 [Tanacetum coccineum]